MNYETFVSSESFVLLYLPKMIFQKQLKKHPLRRAESARNYNHQF